MKDSRAAVRLIAGLLLAALPIAAPATATTLVRQGLDRLGSDNETIVQARVLDLHSYWNSDHTFILTDVRARASRILKGSLAGEVTFTVMGGTVGDVTTLLIGGPRLVPGSEYVLFLAHADLPGTPHRLTVRDHAQGVFDVENDRAFSQAIGDPLLPDEEGLTQPPGAEQGLRLDDLIRRIRETSNR